MALYHLEIDWYYSDGESKFDMWKYYVEYFENVESAACKMKKMLCDEIDEATSSNIDSITVDWHERIPKDAYYIDVHIRLTTNEEIAVKAKLQNDYGL